MFAENFILHIVRVFHCRLRPAFSSFFSEEVHVSRKFHFTHRSGVSLSFASTALILFANVYFFFLNQFLSEC